MSDDEKYMQLALEQAQLAYDLGEVPVGAVVVLDGQVVGRGYNQPITGCDPSLHAEVVAVRDAAKNLANYRLANAQLYVTIEPCTMCAGLLMHARIAKLIYGACEPKSGVIESACQLYQQPFYNHIIEVKKGVLAEQASAIMTQFFQHRRDQKKRLKQQANNKNNE